MARNAPTYPPPLLLLLLLAFKNSRERGALPRRRKEPPPPSPLPPFFLSWKREKDGGEKEGMREYKNEIERDLLSWRRGEAVVDFALQRRTSFPFLS